MSALPIRAENRRRVERFLLEPMYTTVSVQRVTDLRLQSLDGHAYDIGEDGARIELDEALTPGERVAVQLGLPGEDVQVFASARVVWVMSADDDPGPRRAAIQFQDFLSEKDRGRLLRFLGSGLARRAA